MVLPQPEPGTFSASNPQTLPGTVFPRSCRRLSRRHPGLSYHLPGRVTLTDFPNLSDGNSTWLDPDTPAAAALRSSSVMSRSTKNSSPLAFELVSYDSLRRELTSLETYRSEPGNTVYVSDLSALIERRTRRRRTGSVHTAGCIPV
jgi:hypothetical protein